MVDWILGALGDISPSQGVDTWIRRETQQIPVVVDARAPGVAGLIKPCICKTLTLKDKVIVCFFCFATKPAGVQQAFMPLRKVLPKERVPRDNLPEKGNLLPGELDGWFAHWNKFHWVWFRQHPP